jgi:hypothetical protein
MYARLTKALYGTLQAALLFWKNLVGYLEEEGFTFNPYDECVANKVIDGKQLTVLWHVDDLKGSHVSGSVLDRFIKGLNDRYGQAASLVFTRGKVHDYLGMTLDYSEEGKVKVRMENYVANILAESPEDMEGTSTCPASLHLMEVNPSAAKLSVEQADMFHHLVAKLLFLAKRARPDIQTAVAFLTTRVKSPDVDDWKKLGKVIKYLREFPDLHLTLEAGNGHVVKWWVDAAFAVHPDMKSHTGGTMSLGKGSVYSTSVRQKLNTRSSTEAELVGVDDVMPMVLWTKCFLEAQGYGVTESKIYQDNMSAILLERNGTRSSTKRTRHINIRYFFVADRIASGDVVVEYCPTNEMLGDFFTKPLQGSKFRKFRDLVLNSKN